MLLRDEEVYSSVFKVLIFLTLDSFLTDLVHVCAHRYYQQKKVHQQLNSPFSLKSHS